MKSVRNHRALGHVHEQAVLHKNNPFVAYPGNIQGRHIREAGPRGALLVHTNGSSVTDYEFITLDSVRWLHLKIDIQELQTFDDLLEQVRDRAAARDRSCILRVTLTGRGPLHRELDQKLAGFLVAIREVFASSHSGQFIWVERLENQTRPEVDLEERAKAEDFVGTLLRLAEELKPEDVHRIANGLWQHSRAEKFLARQQCEHPRDRLVVTRADLRNHEKWNAAADKARDRFDIPEPGGEAVPLWLVAIPLIVGSGLAAVLMQQELSKVAGVLFVLMVALAGALYLWRASTLSRTAKMREEHSRRAAEARAQLAEAEAELLAITQNLTTASAELGLSPPIVAEDLDRLDRELTRENANAERGRTQELQDRQLGEKLERLDQRLQAARMALGTVNEAQSLAAEEWGGWLEAHKLPAGLAPDTARDLLSDLLEAAKALRHAARQNDVAEESSERALTLQRDLSEILQSAGRNASASDLGDQITTLISDLEKTAQHANHRTNLQRRLAEAQRDTDRSAARRTAVEQALKGQVEAKEQADLEWQRAKGDLPAETPEAALEVLQHAATAQNLLAQAMGERAKREETEKTRNDLYLQAIEIFRAAGRGEPTQDDLAIALDRLLAELEQAQKDNEKRSQLLAQRADDTELLEILRERIERSQQEIQTLFDRAGVSDEPSFRSVVEVEKRRSALVQDQQSYETALNVARGGGDLEDFTEELSRADTDELGLQLQILQTTIEQCKERLAELQRDQGRAQQELAALETSDERATLRQREELLKETLRVRAREWAAAALASHLLEEARRSFERERQPDVIKRASEHFSAMTGGRYTRLVAPPGDNKVVMELADGTRRDTSDLSRGTDEQAYLALRLGFVHEFSRRSEPVPLIMDDIFVNFDPERAVAAMKEVLTLSDRHQVLLFTCHPETVERVRQVDPTADVRELTRVHG